jgi:lipoprotein NlpI
MSVLLYCVLFAAAADGPTAVERLMESAKAAWQHGEIEEAFKLADKAVAAAPRSAAAYELRGSLQDARRQHAAALADLTKAIALDPRLAEAYNWRGSVHFKLGHIADSVADFDKYLELRPNQAPKSWMRGISLYYAGRYDEGRKQFGAYEAVDTNDVENAVWHYLCNARLVGVDKARAELLRIGRDRRVPMMEVYALFAGKAKPGDILAAAKAGQPEPDQLKQRLFYAHLYLGLYYEAAGDKKQALEHLAKAAEEYKNPHYMGDVARVHVALLRK